MSAKPQTVRGLLARLKRKGVVIALVDGRVQVQGWRQLTPAEKAELREEKERVVTWLESRELRRQRRAARKRQMRHEQQQPSVAMPPQQPERRVVGCEVRRGREPKLIYDDELTAIDVRRAHVLGTIPYFRRQ